MPGALKGGPVGSIKAAKAAVKKGGGGGDGQWLTRVREDGLTVRFLTEPDGWVQFWEHFDEDKGFFVPDTEDCEYCDAGMRPSKRVLANAVDIDENKVIPLVMAASVGAQVMKKFEKYKTLLDRDYEITREGSGMDTEYDVTPEPPTKMKLSKFDLLDLWGTLESQINDDDEDDDDDDEEEEEKPKSKKSKSKGKGLGKPKSEVKKRPRPGGKKTLGKKR